MKQLGLPIEPIEVKFCPACGGSQRVDGEQCPLCKGEGVVPLEWDPGTAEIGF